MRKYFLLAFSAGLFLIPFGLHSALAETWYPGEGLKVGDYYRYSVCFTDWHNCTPIELDFWIQNKTNDGSGYNVQFLAIDGSNIRSEERRVGKECRSRRKETYTEKSRYLPHMIRAV